MKMHGNTLITCTAILLEFYLVSCITHYCVDGDTQSITGEPNGTIRTVVSGTNHYGNNLNCGWVIDGGLGSRVQLTITSVNLQLAPTYTSCGSYDHLSIKDGDASTEGEITSICGSRNPYEIISSGQYIYLSFYSNDKNFYDHSGVSVSFQVFGNNNCPPDWTSLNTTDQCYRIRQSPSAGVDWYSAFHNCLFSQGNLAIINDHQVFNYLLAHAKSLSVTSAWIGLTDIEKEGTLKWLNNQNLASYISYGGNNEDSDCSVFDFNTQSFDIKECKRGKHLAVCQRNQVGSTEKYSIPTESEEDKNQETFNVRVILIIVGVLLASVIITIVIVIKIKRKRQYKRANQSVDMDSVPEGHNTVEPNTLNDRYHTAGPPITTRPPPVGNLEPSAPPSYEYAVNNIRLNSNP